MTQSSGPGERPALPPAPPANHGNTRAAWVTVTVIMIGALVAALAVVAAQPWLFWVGLGIAALGLVVGRVMRWLGFGQPSGGSPTAKDA